MTEEEKAISFLMSKVTNYDLESEELHYYTILFNLIINQKNKLEKYEEIKKNILEYIETNVENIKIDTIKHMLKEEK